MLRFYKFYKKPRFILCIFTARVHGKNDTLLSIIQILHPEFEKVQTLYHPKY